MYNYTAMKSLKNTELKCISDWAQEEGKCGIVVCACATCSIESVEFALEEVQKNVYCILSFL